MLLTEEEVNHRLSSPLNLINKINKKEEARELEIFNPRLNNNPPSIDELIENADDKIKIAATASKALTVLEESVTMIGNRLNEVEKVRDLSKVARDMSTIVGTIDEIKNSRAGITKNQLVIWQPIIMTENHYEVIHVNE